MILGFAEGRPLRVPKGAWMSSVPMPSPYPEGVLSVDIRFLCPSCGCKLRIDALAAGYRAVCAQCGITIKVPPVPDAVIASLRNQPDSGSADETRVILTREEIAFLTEETGSAAPSPRAAAGK